ncbi:MAG: 7-cyano-7-deazaguanine synthase [Deltaproteobacteria bacterium]|nr:7-cyano-7-deazaguanine synthase [Deltaproteobacteria bacterium]
MKAGVPSNNSITILASGGADSAVLLDWAIKKYRRVHPVYVKQGYCWEKAEIYWLKKFLRQISRGGRGEGGLGKLKILEAPMGDVLKNHWSLNSRKVPGVRSSDKAVYLPGRNLFLFSKAAAFCAEKGIGSFAVGSLKGNPFSDARPLYFRGLEKIFHQSLGFAVKIKSPFVGWKKKDVLHYGRGLPFHLTFSCLNPRGIKSCGRCNKCAERIKVFSSFPPSPAIP